MEVKNNKSPAKTETLTRDQLEVYASELRQHYQTERQLRREVEQQNSQLERRVRELTALNQLFRQHLEERRLIVNEYQAIRVELSRLHGEFYKLIEHANALDLPDVEGNTPSVQTS